MGRAIPASNAVSVFSGRGQCPTSIPPTPLSGARSRMGSTLSLSVVTSHPSPLWPIPLRPLPGAAPSRCKDTCSLSLSQAASARGLARIPGWHAALTAAPGRPSPCVAQWAARGSAPSAASELLRGRGRACAGSGSAFPSSSRGVVGRRQHSSCCGSGPHARPPGEAEGEGEQEAEAQGVPPSPSPSLSSSLAESNEVQGGRSVEWMGDAKEVEIASRLVAQWKKDASVNPSRGPEQSQPRPASGPASALPETESIWGVGRAPHPPPQDVLLKAVSDLSRNEGRTARTTNVVIGGTAASDYGDDWLELDKKVNKYPSFRGFTAIGTGGEDFVASMVVAVESVLEERIPKWQVSARESAGGRYVSVKIGPVRMESSDQVRAVYEAMRKDQRMRYFL